MRFPQASSSRARLKWRWEKRNARNDRNQPGGLAVGRPGNTPVAHCGTSMAGAFVRSPTFTDIWGVRTENRAVWNRSKTQIVERIRDIEKGPAFEVEGFDSDNGSGFLNWQLLRYFRERAAPVEFTRSRPYRKNDNAHVEQKQWTHVRELPGYDRFEGRWLVKLVNDLYRNEWRAMQNFFLPVKVS